MKKSLDKNNNRSKKIIYSILITVATFLILCLALWLFNFNSVTIHNYFLMVSALLLIMGGFGIYIFYIERGVAYSPRKVGVICCAILLSYFLVTVLDMLGGVFLAPLAFCALLVTMLISAQCGFFANFTVVLVVLLSKLILSSNGQMTEQLLYILIAGVMSSLYASYAVSRHFRRLMYVVIGLLLSTLAMACATVGFFIFENGAWNGEKFLRIILYAFGGGLINVMLLFVIAPLFEVIFNVTSDFRLAEITSTSQPLLVKMYNVAPGTFNHSLTVSNYIEACAAAIGEDTFLARAAGYYHDIGKIKDPKFFIENQIDGHNPHDEIYPEASVSAIKKHVANGLALAKEYRLPIEVQKAIIEHHGTMPIMYFYAKAQKYTDGDLPYDSFSYDGPLPSNKISAILMICDACEAALRANGDKMTAEKIVDDIVSQRIEFNQFVECDITMKDIEIVKNTIITTYRGIQHKRVKYPKIKKEIDK